MSPAATTPGPHRAAPHALGNGTRQAASDVAFRALGSDPRQAASDVAFRALGSDPRQAASDVAFRALGTTIRLIGRGPLDAARELVHEYDRRLSRFRPASELCALNADPRPVVPASALLRDAVRAGLGAARASGGLVDPCLLDQLEAAGYRGSFVAPPVPLPPPTGPAAPALPDPRERWRAISVDDAAGTVSRPPGLRLDLGGSGKGHLADLVAAWFGDGDWVVSCGGDLRVGGERAIHVDHPLGGAPAACLHLRDAAAATSSVVARAWRGADGQRAHHLLDPSTGRPAWTGVLSATAVADTALEAETLAKVALLGGPDGARSVLSGRGGVLVLDGGAVEVLA